jgi:hypothetical protein
MTFDENKSESVKIALTPSANRNRKKMLKMEEGLGGSRAGCSKGRFRV